MVTADQGDIIAGSSFEGSELRSQGPRLDLQLSMLVQRCFISAIHVKRVKTVAYIKNKLGRR